MSDDYENLLAGLEDEPAEEEQATESPTRASKRPSRGKGKRKAETVAKSEQRGPRADPAFVQVNANIPKELHASLFFYLKQEGLTLSALVNELLGEWVDDQGGIIAPRKQGAEVKNRKGKS